MGRPKQLFGYDMGSHIDNATIEINMLINDFQDTLKKYPTNPVVWVRFIGRAIEHARAALAELQEAQAIFEANKRRGDT